MDAVDLDYFEAIGEAAFYGPKADFLARDVLGREWQLSTIQVDFIQPARLGLTYIGEDGAGAYSGGTAPGSDWFHRTLFRCDHRAFCGSIPGVADAGAGDAYPDRRPSCTLCRERWLQS